MKKIIMLTVLAAMFACSSIKIAHDFDSQVDFTKFKTYSFTQDELTETAGELNRNRIIKAVEDNMASKELSKAENGDLLIDVYIKSQKKVDVTANTSGAYGYGPYRYGRGGGFSTTTVNYDEYTEGTLFISIIDSSTEKIIWQGTGTKTIDETASAAERDKKIAYSITQILSNYPPQK